MPLKRASIPIFDVLDENESAILLDDIVHDVLATIEAPLSTLFAHYDSFRIDDALRQLDLVNTEYAPVPDDPEALFQLWQREWSAAVFDARRKLLDCDELGAIETVVALPADDKLAQLIEQYRQYLVAISHAEDPEDAVQLMRQCHKEGAVGNKGSAKAWGGKDAKDHAARLLRDLTSCKSKRRAAR